MSDQIVLTGIHGFGYHGLFEHERKNGQDFFVDLVLLVDLNQAANSDLIDDTVNYGSIVDLVLEEITNNPVNLIETLASRIARRVLGEHSKVNSVTVTVHKPQAPVSAKLQDISVSVTRQR